MTSFVILSEGWYSSQGRTAEPLRYMREHLTSVLWDIDGRKCQALMWLLAAEIDHHFTIYMTSNSVSAQRGDYREVRACTVLTIPNDNDVLHFRLATHEPDWAVFTEDEPEFQSGPLF